MDLPSADDGDSPARSLPVRALRLLKLLLTVILLAIAVWQGLTGILPAEALPY